MIKNFLSWIRKDYKPEKNNQKQKDEVQDIVVPFSPSIKGLDAAPSLDEWISNNKFAPNLTQVILSIHEPCLALVNICKTEKVSIGASRIGGFPDMPSDQKWPISKLDNHAMVFLGQLNLSEISTESSLPKSGWLCFFLDSDEPAYNVKNKVMYFPAGTKLSPHVFPENLEPAIEMRLDNQKSFPHCLFTFSPSFNLKTGSESFYSLTDQEQDSIDNLSPNFRSQLLGWHLDWNGDSRRDAYFYANGMESLQYTYFIKPHEYKGTNKKLLSMLKDWHEREKFHAEEINKWKILLTLGSHQEAEMCWWDAGFLEFLIHEDDLANHDFSKVYCNLASS